MRFPAIASLLGSSLLLLQLLPYVFATIPVPFPLALVRPECLGLRVRVYMCLYVYVVAVLLLFTFRGCPRFPFHHCRYYYYAIAAMGAVNNTAISASAVMLSS